MAGQGGEKEDTMKKYYCLNDDDKTDYAAVLWHSSRAIAIETSQEGYGANIYLTPADATRRAAIILGQVRP